MFDPETTATAAALCAANQALEARARYAAWAVEPPGRRRRYLAVDTLRSVDLAHIAADDAAEIATRNPTKRNQRDARRARLWATIAYNLGR